MPPLYGEWVSFINALLSGNHITALGKTPFDAHLDNVWVVIALLFGITVFKTIAMTTTFAAGVPLIGALDSAAGASGNAVFRDAILLIKKEVLKNNTMRIKAINWE